MSEKRANLSGPLKHPNTSHGAPLALPCYHWRARHKPAGPQLHPRRIWRRPANSGKNRGLQPRESLLTPAQLTPFPLPCQQNFPKLLSHYPLWKTALPLAPLVAFKRHHRARTLTNFLFILLMRLWDFSDQQGFAAQRPESSQGRLTGETCRDARTGMEIRSLARCCAAHSGAAPPMLLQTGSC